MFEKFDSDGSGAVDASELGEAFKEKGGDPVLLLARQTLFAERFNYWHLLAITPNNSQLLAITINYWQLLAITGNYWQLLGR